MTIVVYIIFIYLFIISTIAIPIMLRLKPSSKFIIWFVHPFRIIVLFIFPFILSAVLDIAGKSFGLYFTLIILGFILFKYNDFEDILLNNRKHYLVLMVIGLIIFYLTYYTFGWPSGYKLPAILFSALRHFTMWVSLLTLLGYGRKYLNYTNKLSAYFTKAAYPFYLFHQSLLVLIAYYMFKLTNNYWIQIPLIMLLTLLLTITTYEIVKRFSFTKFLFGIK